MMKMDSNSNEERTSEPSVWSNLPTILGVAFLLATLFTAWTPSGLLPGTVGQRLASVLQPNGATATPGWPTPTALPLPRVGIVAGHWGFDSGAVCPDGLKEVQVNLEIASLVQQLLTEQNIQVDLMKEFDPRLKGYRALALVSIHADSCEYINDQATGFKIAAALGTSNPDKARRLTACLRNRYAEASGMPFHPSVTSDMRDYHAYREIDPDTPAAIIETGFLNLDRQMLTQHQETLAQGIAAGILCYVNNESIMPPTPTASP
jgi:N-acetylmuramoyl-L-alanine amidase